MGTQSTWGVHPETESEPHTSTMQTSYTYETTMSTSKSSSSRSKSEARCSSVSSELDEELYSGLNLSDQERLRLAREFYYPPHIAFCGNYYPRPGVTPIRELPMYHTSQGPTIAPWCPAVTADTQNMCTSPRSTKQRLHNIYIQRRLQDTEDIMIFCCRQSTVSIY